MTVTVKLFNQLRAYAPDDRWAFPVKMPAGARIGDLLDRLGIPAGVQRTILINGRRADEKAPIAAGDEIVMMSPMEGG